MAIDKPATAAREAEHAPAVKARVIRALIISHVRSRK